MKIQTKSSNCDSRPLKNAAWSNRRRGKQESLKFWTLKQQAQITPSVSKDDAILFEALLEKDEDARGTSSSFANMSMLAPSRCQ